MLLFAGTATEGWLTVPYGWLGSETVWNTAAKYAYNVYAVLGKTKMNQERIFWSPLQAAEWNYKTTFNKEYKIAYNIIALYN